MFPSSITIPINTLTTIYSGKDFSVYDWFKLHDAIHDYFINENGEAPSKFATEVMTDKGIVAVYNIEWDNDDEDYDNGCGERNITRDAKNHYYYDPAHATGANYANEVQTLNNNTGGGYMLKFYNAEIKYYYEAEERDCLCYVIVPANDFAEAMDIIQHRFEEMLISVNIHELGDMDFLEVTKETYDKIVEEDSI